MKSHFSLLRISTIAIAIALCTSALSGCGDNQDPEGSRALWEELQALNYRDFDRAPGYETRRSSNAPHGDEVDIYVNSIVSEVLSASTSIDAWPEGSLIIKEGFDEDGDQELVAVMQKRSNGWYWAEYFDLSGGEAKFSGQPDVCTNCHRSGDDFVLAFSSP